MSVRTFVCKRCFDRHVLLDVDNDFTCLCGMLSIRGDADLPDIVMVGSGRVEEIIDNRPTLIRILDRLLTKILG